MNIFFRFTLVEINPQRIRKGFAMLCDFTETLRRLYGDCPEPALRLHCELIRSKVTVKVTKV